MLQLYAVIYPTSSQADQLLLISQLTVSGAEQNETVGWKTLETLLKLFCQSVLCGR